MWRPRRRQSMRWPVRWCTPVRRSRAPRHPRVGTPAWSRCRRRAARGRVGGRGPRRSHGTRSRVPACASSSWSCTARRHGGSTRRTPRDRGRRARRALATRVASRAWSSRRPPDHPDVRGTRDWRSTAPRSDRSRFDRARLSNGRGRPRRRPPAVQISVAIQTIEKVMNTDNGQTQRTWCDENPTAPIVSLLSATTVIGTETAARAPAHVAARRPRRWAATVNATSSDTTPTRASIEMARPGRPVITRR